MDRLTEEIEDLERELSDLRRKYPERRYGMRVSVNVPESRVQELLRMKKWARRSAMLKIAGQEKISIDALRYWLRKYSESWKGRSSKTP